MRWLGVAVYVGLVAAAIGVGLREDETEPPGILVSIGEATPYPDPEDFSNTLGNRYWHVDPPVTLRLQRACANLEVRGSGVALFNGRRVPGWETNGSYRWPGAQRAGYSLRERESAYAAAGDVVRMTMTASCGADRVAATRDFRLPPASCGLGPIRAFEVTGGVVVRDERRSDRPTAVPLRAGDLVAPTSWLRVGRKARVVLAAPECNGYRVSLGPGDYFTGGYDSGGVGYGFEGEAVEARGDAHAGGFAISGKGLVRPLELRCRGCSQPIPAEYAVRSRQDRAVVRVSAGRVSVRGAAGRPVRVRAGEQSSIVCAPRIPCRATKPRLFQPNEPWFSLAAGDEPSFPRTLAGERPPDGALAPARSQVTVVPLRGGRVPDQLFVAWQRELRRGRGLGADRLETEKGVLVWQASGRGDARRWRVAYTLRYPWSLSLGGPQVADVTGDGHPEALITTVQGSGACGVRRVIGSAGGRTTDLFRTPNVCEWSAKLAGGALVLHQPVGPCPYREVSAHCFGGTRRVERRWNGTRLVTARVSVRCALPRLDPTRECRPRR